MANTVNCKRKKAKHKNTLPAMHWLNNGSREIKRMYKNLKREDEKMRKIMEHGAIFFTLKP